MSQNTFKIISAFVFLGFLATMGLLALRFIAPTASQFHLPAEGDTDLVFPTTMTREQADANIWSVIIDNFFIVGYTGIFIGAYLYVREVDYYAKFAFVFGLVTTAMDIVENAFIVAISNSMAMTTSYKPEPLLWGIFWSISAVKDISAYISAFTFAVLFLLTLNDKPSLRSNKLIFVVLLLFFALIGSLGLFNPTFLTIRNVLFVLDLVIASILFYKTDESVLS